MSRSDRVQKLSPQEATTGAATTCIGGTGIAETTEATTGAGTTGVGATDAETEAGAVSGLGASQSGPETGAAARTCPSLKVRLRVSISRGWIPR